MNVGADLRVCPCTPIAEVVCMSKDKVVRNDPCPCGSGVKYKKCCLSKGMPNIPRIVPDQATIDSIKEGFHAEEARKEHFGNVKPIISAEWHGFRCVAVGKELHFVYSEKCRTFIDFLKDVYIKHVLGIDWGNSELAKPLEERHEIFKWYDAMCRFQNEQVKDSEGLYSGVPNGAMHAYLVLAYDLYVLQHHVELQKSIVRRLKHPDQFQGVRQELLATASCIRAGFDIKFEDETESGKKHVEFIASHRITGQRIAVEAKSRHRPGVLGYPGTAMPIEDIEPSIERLLKKALVKQVILPYVIFFDLNLPPTSNPDTNSSWLNQMVDSLIKTSGVNEGSTPFNMIVFSNHPDHYCINDVPYPRGWTMSFASINPIIIIEYGHVLQDIHIAAEKHGIIPNMFDEA
jgi:uncharacterized protein YchJ